MTTATDQSVPVRSEVRLEDTWDLTPLYPSDEAWEQELAKLAEEYPEITRFKGCVTQSPGSLKDCLEFEKSIEMRIEQLNQFAALRATEDSANPVALAREAKLQGLLTHIGEAFSFIAPEIQSASDEVFAAFLSHPDLTEWVVALRKLRRLKPHTLSPAEERILALGASALGGHQETFSQLTNVDMQFGRIQNSKGRELDLTQSSFSSLLVDRSPDVRKKAFHQFYAEFSDHQFTLAASLTNSVRTDVFYARARNYPSAIEAALFRDDVPLAVYDNLIGSVRNNLKPLYEYYELRRKHLKLAEIHHYDTYVPLIRAVETNVSFDQAIDQVVAAVAPLGDEYTAILSQGLREQRWCDRYENKGKRSGAFSYGTYQSPPYIMMNYKADVFSDVYTLAHEAGHSMHTWYSKQEQSFQNYHYPIFLAEVASTFNEMLLTHYLLEQTNDRVMKAYLINRQIDDLRGTLYRQTMFAEFEKTIHAVEEAGEALTLDVFKTRYRSLLDTYFGDRFVIDDQLELECLRIPHFYNAFYVYKYATGIAAAVALSEQVLKTGDATAYLGFLKSGGSKFPIDTLRDAGVDMSSPEPVEATLRLFAKRVSELQSLVEN